MEDILLLNHVHHELVEGKDSSFLNFCYVIRDFPFVEVLRGRPKAKNRAQKIAETDQQPLLELWEKLN